MKQKQGNSMEMEQKAREARLAYNREWRRKNPDKTREYMARYWAKRAQKEESASE